LWRTEIMSRSSVLLLSLLITAPLFAQKVDVKASSGDDQTLRISVQTKIQAKETRKMLRNGEEMTGGGGRGGGGGGGGGGGDSSSQLEVVFEQGPAVGNWRSYQKLIATESRAGQDGVSVESKIEGALQGKKVTLKVDGGKQSLIEGEGAASKPVDDNIARDIPGRLAVALLLPTNAVAVGEEFDLSKAFGFAIASLVHPVAAARPDATARGQGARAGRGQGADPAGGAGTDAGGTTGGGRGQGGQGARGGMARMGGGGVGAAATQLIAAGKLTVKATGKLASVEEKNGEQMAILDITASMTGKGKATELGLRPQAAFGGGGGQGRGQGRGQGGAGAGGDAAAPAAANAGTDNVDANLTFKGKVYVNLTTKQITEVEMAGDLKVDRKTVRTMAGRDGEETELDTTANTEGKLELKAVIAIAPSKDAKK
jgi:hypothetical protein